MSVVIDKISFENYRQYGSGYIHFNTESKRMLSVIVAKNGTGKTTLLNAITWCLYGKELHLGKEETALPIVNSAVVKKAKVGDVLSVKVTISIQDENTNIEFQRAMNYKVTKENSVIKGNSELTATVTQRQNSADSFTNTMIKTGVDAEIIVKQYFDEAIYKFYFFDGEKLRDFFTASQANSIQQSIFNISQVTLLENSYSRLNKMHKDNTRTLAKDSPNIEKLSSEQENLEMRLSKAKENLTDNREQFDELTKKRENLDVLLRGYEPVKKLQEERSGLENAMKQLAEEEANFHSERSGFIRQYTILINLYPRVSRTLAIIKEKEENGDLPPAIDKDQVKQLLMHIERPCPLCNGTIGEDGRKHLESLLDRISVSSKTSMFLKEIKGSLEAYVEQTKNFRSKLKELRQVEIDLKNRKNDLESRLQEITGTLSNYDSDSSGINVAKVEEERSRIIQQINAASRSIGAAEETIKACNEQLATVKKALADETKKMDKHNEIRRQIEVINMILTNFKQIKDDIVEEVQKEIEKTTWNYFDKMIWKKNTFGSLKISDSYDISVYNKEHVEMTGSLSATEQMALAYAFTLAIHNASGKNCPIVIDSPLGRVSDENRENMAEALKKVSEEKQIIMLFTPDEYSESVQKIYDKVAEVRELTLTSDENYVEGIEH